MKVVILNALKVPLILLEIKYSWFATYLPPTVILYKRLKIEESLHEHDK